MIIHIPFLFMMTGCYKQTVGEGRGGLSWDGVVGVRDGGGMIGTPRRCDNSRLAIHAYALRVALPTICLCPMPYSSGTGDIWY